MLNYWELLTAWYQLKTFQYKPLEKIKRYQFDRFKKLIFHAYERIPMYRELYDSHNFNPGFIKTYEDIEKVPIINKEIIRAFPLKKRINAQVSEEKIYKDRTSGSSGQPTEIWTSKTVSLIESFKGIRFLREWGYSPFDSMVKLWRADTKPSQAMIQRLGMFRRQLISILDDPEITIDILSQTRCDVLLGMRSTLEILGEELNKRGIKITPRILIPCGEMLTEEHRQFFKETYGCNSLEIYSSVETGNMAWECPENPGNLHIQMDSVLINFHNLQVTSDEKQIGSIVATNLKNFVMPFIRYDVGDLILLPEHTKCLCGRTLPLLGKVYGRNADIIEYHGRKFNFHFFHNFFHNYLYIQRHKIVQMQNGDIEFRIQLFEDTNENRKRCVSDLTSALNKYFSPLNIKFVNGFPIAPNEKFKIIEKL